VNSVYQLEPILIIFGTYMLKLLASKRVNRQLTKNGEDKYWNQRNPWV